MRQLALVEDPQEVGLVLVGIGRAHELEATVPLLDPRVVAGRHLVRPVGGQAAAQQLVELDVLVAGLARVRRGAGQVAVRERVDHPLLEGALEVQREERNADQLGDPTSVVVRVRRAAAAALLVPLAAIGMEAHPDAHHLVRGLRGLSRQQRGGHARVHSAAHGGHDAGHQADAT